MLDRPALKRIYDVSMPIRPDMPVYRNRTEKRPVMAVTRDFGPDGTGLRESRVTLDTHTGTHLDAPRHLFPDGAAVEGVPLDSLMGPCRVLDLTWVRQRITTAELAPHGVRPGEFPLLKTGNSRRGGFAPDFVFLSADGARHLADRRVRGVGIDALGIERDQPRHPTHQVLLGNGIVILEGLQLGAVPPGEYFLVAAPLALWGADAAPARVFLLDFR